MKKKFGSMGLIDIQQMNWSLFVKWLWRFKDPTSHSLWKDVVKVRYYSNHPMPYSSFWQAIIQKEQISQLGIIVKPGSQGNVSLW